MQTNSSSFTLEHRFDFNLLQLQHFICKNRSIFNECFGFFSFLLLLLPGLQSRCNSNRRNRCLWHFSHGFMIITHRFKTREHMLKPSN